MDISIIAITITMNVASFFLGRIHKEEEVEHRHAVLFSNVMEYIEQQLSPEARKELQAVRDDLMEEYLWSVKK